MVISRFDIFLINLDPTVGHEIKKTRPCIVVSPDEMNRGFWTIIVVPMTSRLRALPTRVPITFDGRDGQVLLDQIRAVDRERLVKKLGVVDKHTQQQISSKLQTMFAS